MTTSDYPQKSNEPQSGFHKWRKEPRKTGLPWTNLMFRATAFMALFWTVALTPSHGAEPILRPNDRVVFIGDSITVQGGNSPTGWMPLMKAALGKARPGVQYTFIPLGAGGHTLESWQDIEKKSRINSVMLGAKDIDAKAELDQKADVVVCMLGMNNVLVPRLRDREEDYDLWESHCIEFIKALRERVRPRVFAIATPTLCTEDPASPKNKVLGDLIARIGKIAASENCIVLPTHDTMRWMLEEGRTRQPEFRVTTDYVHPNQAGHTAIAVGMLKGLSEPEAAAAVLKDWLPKLWNDREETLSYHVERLAEDGEKERFNIHYFYRNPSVTGATKVNITVPNGWKVVSSNDQALNGNFIVEGIPDRLNNEITLEANSKKTRVGIPAPWLLGIAVNGTDSLGRLGWNKLDFDPEKGKLPIDDELSQGKTVGQALEFKPGYPLVWKRYVANIGYAGGSAPGAIDIAAVDYFTSFDICYGARWIYSDKELSANVEIVSLGPSGRNFLTLWLNGADVYRGFVPIPAEKATIHLNKGWNALVFKCNHREWRWQFAIELRGESEEAINQLKVSTSPIAVLK